MADFIANDPVGGAFAPGAPLRLVVETDGGTYEYQWQRNGIDIFGATDSTYSIAALDETTAGDYLARVFNVSTVDTSAVATVTIRSIDSLLTIAWDASAGRPVLTAEISDGANASYEVSTDLLTWFPLTRSVVVGEDAITDTASVSHPMRFYRLRID